MTTQPGHDPSRSEPGDRPDQHGRGWRRTIVTGCCVLVLVAVVMLAAAHVVSLGVVGAAVAGVLLVMALMARDTSTDDEAG